MAPGAARGRRGSTPAPTSSPWGGPLRDGRRAAAPFAGKSRARLIAAMLSAEPPPLASLQPMTPPRAGARGAAGAWPRTPTTAGTRPGTSPPSSVDPRGRHRRPACPGGWRRARRGPLHDLGPRSLGAALAGGGRVDLEQGELAPRRSLPSSAGHLPAGLSHRRALRPRRPDHRLRRGVGRAGPGSSSRRGRGATSRACSAIPRAGGLDLALRRDGPAPRSDGDGTLARAPLAGGAPRELMESVPAADWMPDGSEPRGA